MKLVLSLLAIFLGFSTATAQYNPDSDSNGVIDTNDLLAIFEVYGMPFTPQTPDCCTPTVGEVIYDYGVTDEGIIALPSGFDIIKVSATGSQSGFDGVSLPPVYTEGGTIKIFCDPSLDHCEVWYNQGMTFTFYSVAPRRFMTFVFLGGEWYSNDWDD